VAEPRLPFRSALALPPRARIGLPLLAILLALLTAYLYGQRAPRAQSALRGTGLGTTWSVKIAGDLTADQEEAAAREVARRIERVDEAMSTWRPDSELSRFNRYRETTPFPLSPDVLANFEIALETSAASGGALDVTVGPLVDAWGFGSAGRSQGPDDATLARLRAHTGYRKLHLDLAAGTLSKDDPEIACDLSAVAKGYAVDEVARGLEALGHGAFLVEIGGELRARGERPGGGPWRVAIEAPDATVRRVHRVVALHDMAMATSGDYRNYYERDGRRISHTIDPRTGRPITHRLASVTVLHREAARADAWATALDVLGPDEGYAVALREGLAAYLIERLEAPVAGEEGAYRILVTPAFEPYLVAGPGPS